MIEGKVGGLTVRWKTPPQGKSGIAVWVDAQGKEHSIRYQRDDQGLWIETPQGYVGFDVRKTVDEDGRSSVALLRRKHFGVTAGLQFLRPGELATGSSTKVKKGAKVKSQMPGKIVKILVAAGAEVKRGDRLMVMEAMKMENEIKAPQDGKILEVKVHEGQAVETGAELLKFV